MECGTCKLYKFQLIRPLNIYFSAYENLSQASNSNLVRIACKLTYIPYSNNSLLKIGKQSLVLQIGSQNLTMLSVGSCFVMLNKTIDNHFTKINCFDLASF